MKKIFCAVCILFSAAFFLNAEQDNGKLLPSRENYSIENIFYGFSGIFDFPNTFYKDNLKAMTGVGGGFSAEIGYNWSGWLFSAEYLRDMWATKNAAFVRLEKSRNNIFQLRIRRVLSNKTISKFPEWFSLVPGFGAGMNFMQGNYYATQSDKNSGNYNQINFKDREGHSFIMRFSVEAAFDIFKNSEFIPFVGVDYNLAFNKYIAGGISGYPRISLGFRRYPFKNSDRLQRFKKLLDWDQINVYENPPTEPHLRSKIDGSRIFLVQTGDDYIGESNASQRFGGEDWLLEDDSNEDFYIGKEKDSEITTNKTSDDDADNEDEDKDVYYDDSDKKEDYYLPKDEDDSNMNDKAGDDDNELRDDSDARDAGGTAGNVRGAGDNDNARDTGTIDGDNARDAGTGDDTGSGAIVIGEMPTLKVSASLLDGFTPDGDGIDDTVDFMFEATGFEYPPESWTVQIVDDAGNVVKSWSGTGDMPKKITWDGITDSGTLVDGDSEYSVITTVVPDARDTARAGIGMVTDAGTFSTGTMASSTAGNDRNAGDTGDGDNARDAGNTAGNDRDAGDTGDGDNTGDAGTGDDAGSGAIVIGEMPTLKVSASLLDGFTPDGDGIDDTVDFMFEATGFEYPPESWTVQIVDDAGNVVKSWSGTGDMPKKITWDGITDNGTLVDGDREYSVITTVVPDARDTARAGIGMVTDAGTFSTGTMASSTAGNDRNAGDTGDGDNAGDAGTGDDTGSGTIVIGEMPTLKVSSSLLDGFTPDGDGIDDTVDFMFEATGFEYPPESWTVQIVDDAGNVVKSWSGTGDMPKKITWDGITDSGKMVDGDSEYSVITTVVPDARDTARAGIGMVTDAGTFSTGTMAGGTAGNDRNAGDDDNARDTGDTGDGDNTGDAGTGDDAGSGAIVIGEMPTLKVSTSLLDGFTPDGDGIDDTVDFMFEATGFEYPPESWTVQIVDDAGNVVKSWSDNNDNVPEKITWDGVTDSGELVSSDTDYTAIIFATPDERDTARTGITTVTDTGTFSTGSLKDSGLPDARLLMSYGDGLSPDGDGNKDTVDFTFKTHGLRYVPESWKLEIFDPVNNLVRSWSGKGELPESITWDGTTSDGDIVAALSNYPIILSVVPDARERGRLETGVLVDRQVMRTGILIIDETDTLQPDNLPKEPQPVEKTTEPETDKQPVEKAPESETDKQPTTEDKSEPKQNEPEPSVSDKQPVTEEKPGTTPSASDKQPATEDKPEPKQDKPEPSVSDKQPAAEEKPGTTPSASDKQPTEKESEPPIPGTAKRQWRLISVPVYFDPDAATFNLISEENKQSNISVLNKIAAEIKKYGNSATVLIEGHANNVSNTEREHIEELIPLSQERAEVVRQLLIERGIDADHLTAEGVGGSAPNAQWTDRRNWWQNRRVEFIITVEE